MSTSIHRVLENFYWKIEGTTPTNTTVRNRFERFNPYLADVPDSTAGLRKFWVEWLNSDGDIDATDITAREAWHTFAVIMQYPCVLDFVDQQQMLLQDRDDLAKALRDPASWKGYSSSESIAEIGLMHRERSKDGIDKSNRAIIQVITHWSSKIRESEI